METDFIQRLRIGERAAMKQLYTEAFPPCASLIMSNKGNREDAKDYFHEGLVILINNLKKPDFVLTCKPATYLYSVIRNLWLKHLNKDTKSGLSLIIDNPDYQFVPIDNDDDIEEKEEIESKHELIAKIVKEELKEDCRKVILAFYFKKQSMAEIAAEHNYTAQFARVKKNRCMNTLRKIALGK